MKNFRLAILLAAAIMVMAAGQGFGLTQFNDGDIHDIGTINDDVWVDYQAPGMQTTVNVYGGISYPYKLQGFNSGIINISGGFVTELDAHDSSQTTLSEGGDIRWMYAYNSSQRTISGGSFSSIFGYDSSQTTISGGDFSMMTAFDSSQTTISGGSVDYFYLYNNSKITVNGSNFTIDGSPVGYGEITSTLGGSPWNEPYRRLTGTLANGDIINNQFRIGDDAKIVLVPEPATLLLLGLGGLILRKKG